MQNEAARVVTGLTLSVSLQNLNREVNWLSLAERRKYQKLLCMFRVNNDNVPNYLLNIFPDLRNHSTSYNLRNCENYSVPIHRTQLFSNSFVPSSTTLWNNLSHELKSATSINSFKHLLNKEIFPTVEVPRWYLIGERKFSIIHARMRNSCSNLNFHLFCNHLSQNAFCSCGEVIENEEHFLFVCPKYSNLRVKLFHDLRIFHPLNTNLLLFGKPELSYEDNCKIFLSVQNYIKGSKRF